MKYTVNETEKRPAYMQLYIQLRDDIIHGLYQKGTRMPSKRVLAEETGVSVVTAEHAYLLLAEEGYIEARERSGYFVSFSTGEAFASPAEVYDNGIRPVNSSPGITSFPFSVLAKTMRNVLSTYGEGILMRSPDRGCTELREAICEYLARSRGIETGPEEIIIGAGSEYLYNMIVQLIGRDKTYAIESPSYNKIEQVYSGAGATLEKLPLGNDGIRSSALKGSRADVLHITPYRSFPSGVTASASKRHEYLRWAEKGGRLIVEDDFESEFAILKKPEDTLFSLSKLDNVIYMNTFSVSISPSLRTAYMVLPRSLSGRYSTELSYYSCMVPTYIQFVIASLIRNGDFERHINRIRRNKRKETR